jgi:acyl-coenzyme A thioesterase PaaI-like protein
MPSSPGPLFAAWNRLRRVPGGTWIFSRLLGWKVPYTGSIGAHVRELGPGHARITLRDRRAVRQHLGSVHAVALLNLGEVTSGLAMLAALPPGVRGIVTRLSAEYPRKARGLLTAVSRVTVPAVTGPTEVTVMAEITDESGDLVCTVTATWRLDRTGSRQQATGNRV